MDGSIARARHGEADRLIREMYTGQVGWSARERAHDLKLRAAFVTLRDDPDATNALHRLVYGLTNRRRWFGVEPVLALLGPQAGNTGLDALLHFARFHAAWQGQPEEWIPTGDGASGAVGSLARHLFAHYPLPTFLDAAWLLGFTDSADAYRRWFVHLGAGEKQEALRFPLPMTHRAAHFFLLAPPDVPIPAALHWGQIRALGGSDALARAVGETFLSELQTDETFWYTVIQFLVNHPELPLPQVGPVLDYLRFRKFGTGGDDGPEPNLSMKGRTVDALRLRVAEWHETLDRLGKKARQTWNATGIPPLERVEKDSLSAATCHWKLVELTDTLSLLEEGRDMRHCVRSYADACLKGTTSIWSLRLTLSDNPAMRRMLTIEVNNNRRSIVQVRGKCNQSLSAMRGNRRMMQARDLLKEWALTRHLGIACAV